MAITRPHSFRFPEPLFALVARVAAREERSVSRQLLYYVRRGLREDGELDVERAGDERKVG